MDHLCSVGGSFRSNHGMRIFQIVAVIQSDHVYFAMKSEGSTKRMETVLLRGLHSDGQTIKL